jgi:hypothetical protein
VLVLELTQIGAKGVNTVFRSSVSTLELEYEHEYCKGTVRIRYCTVGATAQPPNPDPTDTRHSPLLALICVYCISHDNMILPRTILTFREASRNLASSAAVQIDRKNPLNGISQSFRNRDHLSTSDV